MTIRINSTPNSNNTSFKGKSFCISNQTVSNFLDKRVSQWSSPAQRVLLGVTGVAIQPAIDLHNNKVDEETRIISSARTMAKIVAGTTTGFIIRSLCIKGIEKWTDMKAAVGSKGRALIPTDPAVQKELSENLRSLKNHRKALGTCLALVVMLFTNFALDVPLTKFLTNVFTKKFKKAGEIKTAQPADTTIEKNIKTDGGKV